MADEPLKMEEDAELSADEQEEAEEGSEASAESEAAPERQIPEVGVLVRLKSLPKVITDYLYSPALANKHAEIFAKHGLKPDEADAIYYAELQVFLGEIPMRSFPNEVWSLLPWEDSREEDARALVRDLMGFVFLPAQAHLGDVAAVIIALGGDVAAYPAKQLEKRVISYREASAEIASTAALSAISGADGDISLADVRSRVAFVVESRLRNVRDDAETREALMKPRKIGGASLSAKVADSVVELAKAQMRMTQFVETTETERARAEAAQYKPEDIKRIYAGTEEERQEISRRMERFAQVIEGSKEKAADAFLQVLTPAEGTAIDPLYVVAGMLVLAEGNRLTDLLENDPRYRELLRNFLEESGMEGDVPAFDEEPSAPHFVNLFLQMLLEGIARLDEADAARFALRYANILKKQGHDRYTDIAAFDTATGTFRWQDRFGS